MATLIEWDNDVPDYEVLRARPRGLSDIWSMTRTMTTSQQTASRS